MSTKLTFNMTRGSVRCWSCRRRTRRLGNFCFGCRHFVCLRCVDTHGHFGRGKHGKSVPRKTPRSREGFMDDADPGALARGYGA